MSRTIDRSAPLPLGYQRALEQAQRLRARRWAWTTIADAMSVYHGWTYHATWWANQVKAIDPTAARPRGKAYTA